MITGGNLNNLYQLVLQKNEITTKDLSGCGFNSTDITNLIKQGIVARVKRGVYKFLAVEKLCEFGKVFKLQNNVQQAEAIYKKCLEIDPQNRKSIHQLFFFKIFEDDYEEAFKYLTMMEQYKTTYTEKDMNMYLFLLNHLMDLPEEYQVKAKNFTLNSLLMKKHDARCLDHSYTQKITQAVFTKRFGYAAALVKRYTDIFSPNYRDLLIRHLVFEVANKENMFKQELLELAKKKEYSKLKQLLETKSLKCNLSKSESYFLKVANIILNPNAISVDLLSPSSTTFDAIDASNFNVALMICAQYNESIKRDSNNDILFILLTDLITKIKELEETKGEKSVTSESHATPIDSVDILHSLLQNNYSQAFMDTKKYLNSIHMDEYEFLIIDLIKLSLAEKDKSFSKPMIVLTHLSRGDYEFNVFEYIQEFYKALSNKQYSQARIYLDIICQANKLGKPTIAVEHLVDALNEAEIVINSKQSGQNKFTQQNPDQAFIEAKHQMLLNGHGIVLLKPMNEARRKNIHRLVERYPDMKSFSIGEGKNRRIVLRYRPFLKEFISINDLINQGNDAYKQGDYQTCIDAYLKILQFGTPRSIVYAKLGLAYMKMKNMEEATSYLTVATQLSKKEKQRLDFTELILKINGQLKSEEIKPVVEMTEDSFNSNSNSTQKIDILEKITEIVMSTGKSVESVGIDLGLSFEQINVIKLTFARSYYSQGDYQHGDLFVRSVEQTPEKSIMIMRLLNEIKLNKRFYINRQPEEAKTLSLTIKP